MKTTITVGQSVQVFEVGKPERWNKITISKEFEDISNEQVQIDLLMEEVKIAHDKYSQSFVEPQIDFVGATKKESIEDLKKELNAGRK